jgi:hypothetical protein
MSALSIFIIRYHMIHDWKRLDRSNGGIAQANCLWRGASATTAWHSEDQGNESYDSLGQTFSGTISEARQLAKISLLRIETARMPQMF